MYASICINCLSSFFSSLYRTLFRISFMILFLFLLISWRLSLLWHESASFFSCFCFCYSSASFSSSYLVLFSHIPSIFSPALMHDLVILSHCSCGSFMSICSIQFCLSSS